MAGKNVKAVDDEITPDGARPGRASDESDVEGHGRPVR